MNLFLVFFLIGIKKKIKKILFPTNFFYLYLKKKPNEEIFMRQNILFFNNEVLFKKSIKLEVITKSLILKVFNYFFKKVSNWLIFSFTEIKYNKKAKNNIYINLNYTKDILLEFLWSIFPLLILLLLVGPSLGLLYSSSLTKITDPFKPFMTLKIVGAMWYWNYQYPTTINNLYDIGSFDSYLSNNIIFKSKIFNLYRNLTVDEVITLPTFKYIRLLITSQDTIHSWAVPSLGIKVDACPGRLNQVYLQVLREGFFFGQCSELCGLNHAFMPINLKALHLYKLY